MNSSWNRASRLTLSLALSACMMHGSASGATATKTKNSGKAITFAMINNNPVGMDVLNQKIEQLYPSDSVHGKGRVTPELRQKAIDAVIVDELIWRQALKKGKIVPVADAEKNMLGFREQYGAQKFDTELASSGLAKDEYVAKLQRLLTIASARREHVTDAAKISAESVKAYFDANNGKFVRPERAHFRLILVAVAPKASPKAVSAAKKKVGDVYAKLKKGADFGDLASEFSDDIYRVKGGDVGWMHKGSIDAEFETIVFTIPVGQYTAPFRSSKGFSILKLEGRELAKQMSFDEVRDKLHAQLVARKTKELQQAWEAELKKGATIRIINRGADPSSAMPSILTQAPIASH